MLVDDPSETREVRILQDVGEILGVDGEDYVLEEGDVVHLPAMNAQPLIEKDAAVVVGSRDDDGPDPDPAADIDPSLLPPSMQEGNGDTESADEADDDDLLMAAMGDDEATQKVGTKEFDEDEQSTVNAGSGVGSPQSTLPLAQLDALEPDERRRAARKRGLSWPTTREARDRLRGAIEEVMHHEDIRVVDAPTALGKSYTVSTTSWVADEQLHHATDGQPVIHLSATRDARDEALEAAREAEINHMVLLSRHEACPVAAGDFDPPSADDADEAELDYQPITIGGQPASEFIRIVCDGRGVPFSAAHRHLEQHNDQGRELPCCEGDDEDSAECPAIAQWDEWRRRRDNDDLDVVFATHNFAHVPGLRTHTNVVIDEEPDFSVDGEGEYALDKQRIEEAVTAYLQAVDAPVSNWESFITMARGEFQDVGDRDDDELTDRRSLPDDREAIQAALDREPDREHYFKDPRSHTLAPALARAIFNAAQRANGRWFGKTVHQPPRLDSEAVDDDGWNREFVSVVMTDDNAIETVRSTPDLSQARSVVGLDAHPSRPLWQVNAHPDIRTTAVLDPEERQLWRRYERGLRVVQVGEATRPLASGEYFQDAQVEALLEHLVGEYGAGKVRTAITTKAVEGHLEQIMERVGCHEPSTMHYGEEKSRNDFGDEDVGVVNGCIDPGDDHVVNILAELDCDAEPETSEDADGGEVRARGRGFVGADADVAEAVLASVRENHTAQAAGRYARNADDPEDTATVFVRTDAMPAGFADVQVPGVTWTYTWTQREIVETLREASRSLTTRELSSMVGCSKEHVRKTLARLTPDPDNENGGRGGVQALPGDGEHGATLYATDGVPTTGVADLEDVTANDPVWGSYTWVLAIRDPEFIQEANRDSPTTPTPSDVASSGDRSCGSQGDQTR